jgi:iron(II)-dependent oxidoreductase
MKCVVCAAHPKGKSIFGISDMVGNIWQVMCVRRYPYRDAVPPHRTRQFTDTYSDGHTRSQLLKGGSYYRPQGSEWCNFLGIKVFCMY